MEQDQKLNIEKIVIYLSSHKKNYIWGGFIALLISALWIFPQPRYYESVVTLAPESSSMSSVGGISSIASSFGFDLGNIGGEDAIYPMLYPDILSSTPFIVGLFDVTVTTSDGELTTDFYDYMDKYQKRSFWMLPVDWVKNSIKLLMPKRKTVVLPDGLQSIRHNPFALTEREDAITKMIMENINCNYDLKTEVITISVRDQDALICASMADSVRCCLQKYITDYRTKKAKEDAAYYEQMLQQAKVEYDSVTDVYVKYVESHSRINLASFTTQRDILENDMNAKNQAYTLFKTQLQAAQAKVQERKPAFTIIQCASVPIKPAGPKRVMFVAIMIVLTFLGQTVYFLRSYLF